MIINEQLFALEDQCDHLIEAILDSQSMKDYLLNKTRLKCPEVGQLTKDFLQAKDDYEQLERFGDAAPDYQKRRSDLHKKKRQLDLNEKVALFRVSETNLQNLLDEICLSIVNTVSDEIKVDAGNPFFETSTHSGCRGNCHAS